MNSASPPHAPAPSLRWWLALTGLPLLVLLLVQWWIDARVSRVDGAGLALGTLFTFLAVYPLCYFFGLSIAAGQRAATALLNGGVAMCALLVAGTALLALVFALGIVSVGLLVIPGIPAAGAAYGLVIDRVQRQLLGESPGWSASWRRLHWISGLIASAAPFGIALFDAAWALPGLTMAAFYALAAAPHLLWTWSVLRRTRGTEFAGARRGRLGILVRLGALGAALPLLVYFGQAKVTAFQERPPVIEAGRIVLVPIADRRYAIPGEWIEHHRWQRDSRRFESLTLGMTLADDGSLNLAPGDPRRGVWLDAYDYIHAQMRARETSVFRLPCRRREFGRFAACWNAPRPRFENTDPLWLPPTTVDFTAELQLPSAERLVTEVILLDEAKRPVARLLKYVYAKSADSRRYRLIVLDGAVRWTVPIADSQLPALDRIVDGVSRLQRDLAVQEAGGS